MLADLRRKNMNEKSEKMARWRKKNRHRYNNYHLDYYYDNKHKINESRKDNRYYEMDVGEFILLIERTARRIARMRKILREREEREV
jgi:hypothetical protein